MFLARLCRGYEGGWFYVPFTLFVRCAWCVCARCAFAYVVYFLVFLDDFVLISKRDTFVDELIRFGGDLLSHVLRRSTIGAVALNCRVRDGIGCFAYAMTTKPNKFINRLFAQQTVGWRPRIRRMRVATHLLTPCFPQGANDNEVQVSTFMYVCMLLNDK